MWHMRAKWAVLEPGLVQMGQTNRTTGRTGQLIVFATEISLAAHTGCGDLMKKENTSSNGRSKATFPNIRHLSTLVLNFFIYVFYH